MRFKNLLFWQWPWWKTATQLCKEPQGSTKIINFTRSKNWWSQSTMILTTLKMVHIWLSLKKTRTYRLIKIWSRVRTTIYLSLTSSRSCLTSRKTMTMWSLSREELSMQPIIFWQFWSGTIMKIKSSLKTCLEFQNVTWSSMSEQSISTKKCIRTTWNSSKKVKSAELCIILLTWPITLTSDFTKSLNFWISWESLSSLTIKATT